MQGVALSVVYESEKPGGTSPEVIIITIVGTPKILRVTREFALSK